MLDVALWIVKTEKIHGGESERIQDRHLSYFRIFLDPGKVFTIYTWFQKARVSYIVPPLTFCSPGKGFHSP